ncbi:DUF1285 domain-containing protein [Thalassospira sp. TSL5-1]|uniref:DUF1285 domain-containing protein n=1 Tax=Thalassospira sp. TSL5-1 TaxID=1544451 RepID=UPI00093FD62D|nr:DUF1285 domain-containing protein [Thalassospira sp. TSL5-1]OKH88747.1 proteophosphoglycan precursor [Thalassospira sp. TSL5-1]
MTQSDKTVDLAENLWKRLRQGKPSTGRHPQICGDIPMSINRDGTWFYQGGPIGRMELVKLFATVLQRDEEGGHWLVTPAEMARIEVEDAAFVVVEVRRETEDDGSSPVIKMRTNIDQWVELDENHPLRVKEDTKTGEPSPYIALDRGLEARLNRASFYQLVDWAEEIESEDTSETLIGVYSHGRFFKIGAVENEEK